jgi:uncharacterized protein (DUF302 family)
MGAWNAPASHRDIAADLKVAVHLPCNVVVQESGGKALVAALDPIDQLGPDSTVEPSVAEAARGALERMLEKVTVPI